MSNPSKRAKAALHLAARSGPMMALALLPRQKLRKKLLMQEALALYPSKMELVTHQQNPPAKVQALSARQKQQLSCSRQVSSFQ
jgi:hypothetical protein